MTTTLEEVATLAAESRELYLARFTDEEFERVLTSVDSPDAEVFRMEHDGMQIRGGRLKLSMEVPERMVLESIERNRRNEGWSPRSIEDLSYGWFRISYEKTY